MALIKGSKLDKKNRILFFRTERAKTDLKLNLNQVYYLNTPHTGVKIENKVISTVGQMQSTKGQKK